MEQVRRKAPESIQRAWFPNYQVNTSSPDLLSKIAACYTHESLLYFVDKPLAPFSDATSVGIQPAEKARAPSLHAVSASAAVGTCVTHLCADTPAATRLPRLKGSTPVKVQQVILHRTQGPGGDPALLQLHCSWYLSCLG